ncbi:acetoin utilization protein AcuC [Sulfobacillus sp. DSM 109850]|uniref:Acetoin utilization protein AcuC n=1 Tax=Sulfobacillus harzensis TaxID=2729629 RepID=A0A7Y0L1E9_9FIRM|nr:acetoin utilization protein AcuC [Sulfobacillus harzensis]
MREGSVVSAVFLYDDAYLQYQFSPDHPFNPVRLSATRDLAENFGLLSPDDVIPPRPATIDELELAHSPHYVDLVRRISVTGKKTYGIERLGLGTEDNPVFRGMHEAAALAAGGTLTAAEKIVAQQTSRALNLAGGLHHAGHGHASGFCIYNDVVAAIRWLRRETGWRVLYVETDAHHGDGVQDAFYRDPEVFFVSLHESGAFLFPGTGHVDEIGEGAGLGTTVNVPLAPATDDASWLEAFQSVVPRVMERFQPDIVISQHGCDGHYWDPLADMCATTTFYAAVPRLLSQWVDAYGINRWIAVGGGGYQSLSVVPRVWTLLWAAVSRQDLQDRPISPDWLAAWEPQSPSRLPRHLMDEPEQFPPIRDRQRMVKANRDTLAALAQQFPEMRFGVSGKA